MVWVIPSRERPHRLAQLIQACDDTGMTTPAVVMLDADDPCLNSYRDLWMPDNWRLEVNPRSGLSTLYNRAFHQQPNEPWYGVICDDVIPETPGWDLELVRIAGPHGLAAPDGSHNPIYIPHFVLGGELVRDVGWLSLPGLDRLYIDTVWTDIATARNVLYKAPHVVLRHYHFSNKSALIDGVYLKRHKAEDRRIYQEWRNSLKCNLTNQRKVYGHENTAE